MKLILTTYFQIRPDLVPEWVIYILVLSMAFIVLSRILFSNNFDSLRSLDKFQAVNDNQNLFGLSFQITYAVLLSTLIYNYLSGEYDFIFYTPVLKILAAAVLILLFFGLRKMLAGIGAYAFGIKPDYDFRQKVFNYYRVLAVMVLWTGVFLFYFSKLNQVVLLIALGLILILIRAFSFLPIFKNKQDSENKILLYNILYLCTLEILPVLVVLKYISLR